MRLRSLLCTVALAGLAASSAHAQARPLRPGDAALLNRPATVDEGIAEAVAKRLTRLSPSVRCGPLGLDVPPGMLVTGITLLPLHGPADYFLLLPQMCNYLAWFREDPSRYDPSTCADDACLKLASSVALALATVSHESYHVLGYRLEKQVECYGMQSIWFVATSLGATAAEGQHIAAYYWRTTYAHREQTTPTYWSAECRDGGRYDLRPASHGWPS
ncbi:MAG: hypothetical protein QOF75_2646 [Gaiellaceae bacterium]|jgi:hypothetical protein|nr:hypothetical protein [Gaiellaceae bacterium]